MVLIAHQSGLLPFPFTHLLYSTPLYLNGNIQSGFIILAVSVDVSVDVSVATTFLFTTDCILSLQNPYLVWNPFASTSVAQVKPYV